MATKTRWREAWAGRSGSAARSTLRPRSRCPVGAILGEGDSPGASRPRGCFIKGETCLRALDSGPFNSSRFITWKGFWPRSVSLATPIPTRASSSRDSEALASGPRPAACGTRTGRAARSSLEKTTEQWEAPFPFPVAILHPTWSGPHGAGGVTILLLLLLLMFPVPLAVVAVAAVVAVLAMKGRGGCWARRCPHGLSSELRKTHRIGNWVDRGDRDQRSQNSELEGTVPSFFLPFVLCSCSKTN